jgi:hypothetical protein
MVGGQSSRAKPFLMVIELTLHGFERSDLIRK